MFWSRKNNVAKKTAGMAANNRYFNDRAPMSTNEKSFSRGAPKVNRFSEPSLRTDGSENRDEAKTIVAAGPKSASRERALAVKNRVLGAPAKARQARHVPPAAFAASRASAAPLDDARLFPMTFLTGENPSETKLKANNALKTSSVKRVQYLINPEALNDAKTARYKAVQQPHHAYIGRNGTPDLIVQADNAPMKDRVSPVGATKVMGWPARHAYAMPLSPQLSSTSRGPSAPHVAVCMTPPNATAGASTAKYRNKQAPALFAGFRNPSNQSWAYSGDRFLISSRTPWSHVFRENGAILWGLAPASPTGNSVDASKVPVNLLPVRLLVDAPVQPTGMTTPLSYNCREEPSFPTNTSGKDTLPSRLNAVTARTSVSRVDAALGTVNSFLVCWGSSWTVARRLVRRSRVGSGGR
mmetsp:Transcript_9665/g.30076  ORF Transcript_9665/g.30076 Transcript_9665/m.30076 type:complete len:412 (-) Transcript_9665:61-1296(-)